MVQNNFSKSMDKFNSEEKINSKGRNTFNPKDKNKIKLENNSVDEENNLPVKEENQNKYDMEELEKLKNLKEKQDKKIMKLEKNLENYEEKITSYKSLVNEYMPEDIAQEKFSIIHSYLNGRDRWFLIKRNKQNEKNQNLFWVRELQLLNLGFNINFNFYKNEFFDFFLMSSNLTKLKEENEKNLDDIEDLKNLLDDHLKNHEFSMQEKNSEIKKENDKNIILNEYIKKLETEKSNIDNLINLELGPEITKMNEENKKFKDMIEDYKINIKNLLEDILKFKSENDKLKDEIKVLDTNKKNYKLINEKPQELKDHTSSSNETPKKLGFSYEKFDEYSDNDENIKNKNDIKEKLKNSILDNLISENSFIKNKKNVDDILR